MVEMIIEQPGVLSQVQDMGRNGWRHVGLPSGGALDSLSLAIANHLVGARADSPALEIALGGFSAQFSEPTTIALAGGLADVELNGMLSTSTNNTAVDGVSELKIGRMQAGARVYLATARPFDVSSSFGSASTLEVAGLGANAGRRLRPGDRLLLRENEAHTYGKRGSVPSGLQPELTRSWVLRAVAGPDAEMFDDAVLQGFFSAAFKVTNRINRMGAALSGASVQPRQTGIASSAIFPGMVQCPPDGKPFLLMADAQTTGGYPRIAQVIRADRHMMGQVSAGDKVRFFPVSAQHASRVLHTKMALYAPWLGCRPFV